MPTDINEAVLKYVADARDVSFVELLKKFPEFVGTCSIRMPEPFNEVLMWNGLSNLCVDVINDLRLKKKIKLKPFFVLKYIKDDAMLKLPFWDGERKDRCWVPVVLDLDDDKSTKDEEWSKLSAF